MLAVSVSQKSSCDNFQGERFRRGAGALRDAARPVIGVTTLGRNDVLLVVHGLVFVTWSDTSGAWEKFKLVVLKRQVFCFLWP
jgi:hypothetical protein